MADTTITSIPTTGDAVGSMASSREQDQNWGDSGVKVVKGYVVFRSMADMSSVADDLNGEKYGKDIQKMYQEQINKQKNHVLKDDDLAYINSLPEEILDTADPFSWQKTYRQQRDAITVYNALGDRISDLRNAGRITGFYLTPHDSESQLVLNIYNHVLEGSISQSARDEAVRQGFAYLESLKKTPTDQVSLSPQAQDLLKTGSTTTPEDSRDTAAKIALSLLQRASHRTQAGSGGAGNPASGTGQKPDPQSSTSDQVYLSPEAEKMLAADLAKSPGR